MTGTLVDIDARKQAEAALQTSRIKLQQSEERYRQLLNNSPVGIINYDRNLVVSYVNERFAEIMKVPVDYMLGLDCTGLKDQRVVPALEQALEGKNTLYEGEYCTSYGQEKIWVSMRCAPIWGECGDVLGGVALLEDITARKDAEQNLRKFKFFSDNAADMLMLTDETTSICYANRAACEALGYRQDELLNMKVPDIDPRNSEKEVKAIIDQGKEQWTPPFETVHRRRDGTEFSVEITARAMQFNGEWLCFTSARDITDRKLLDDRERRHREGLKALNEVAAQSHLPLKQQMRKALQIGARYYDLDCAIISEVSGSDYRVHVFSAPPGTLEEDQCFSLGETYCDLTLTSRDVVAISHMEASPYSGHPCYRKFQLESYLGAPVWVDNSLYGTVNFSSAKPYPRAFDAGDREFIRLLARWIGSVMTLDKSRAALVASEAYLKAIIETEPECVKVMSQDGLVTQMNRAGLEMLEVESVEEINQKGGAELCRRALSPGL